MNPRSDIMPRRNVERKSSRVDLTLDKGRWSGAFRSFFMRMSRSWSNESVDQNYRVFNRRDKDDQRLRKQR